MVGVLAEYVDIVHQTKIGHHVLNLNILLTRTISCLSQVKAKTTESSNMNTREVGSSVIVSVTAVNDRPGLSGVPYNLGVNEDTILVISGITMFDVDADSGNVLVRVSVLNGVVSCPNDKGRCDKSPLNPRQLVCVGDIGEVNRALSLIWYVPDSNWHGADILKVYVDDMGMSGVCPSDVDVASHARGGTCTLSAASEIPISVCSVNDPPWFAELPSQQDLVIAQGTDLGTETSDSVQFSVGVADVDAGDEQVEFEIAAHDPGIGWILVNNSALEDQISFCSPSRSSVIQLEECGSFHPVCVDRPDAQEDLFLLACSSDGLRFRGRLKAVNAVLSNMVYQPIFGKDRAIRSCSHLMSLFVRDLGNSGACLSSPMEAKAVIGISVFEKNSAPVVALEESALSQAVEGAALDLRGNISVFDVDSRLGVLEASVMCGWCSLAFHDCVGRPCDNVRSSQKLGMWTASVSGTSSVLEKMFASVSLIVPRATSGRQSFLEISVDDGGNSGFGGPQVQWVRHNFTSRQVADEPSVAVDPPFGVVSASLSWGFNFSFTAQALDPAETLSLDLELVSFVDANSSRALCDGQRVAVGCPLWEGGLRQRCANQWQSNQNGSGCFLLTELGNGSFSFSSISGGEAQLALRATSTTPDGLSSAVTMREISIRFIEESTTTHISPEAGDDPWICTERARVGSLQYNCSTCPASCVRVSFVMTGGLTLHVSNNTISFPWRRRGTVLGFAPGTNLSFSPTRVVGMNTTFSPSARSIRINGENNTAAGWFGASYRMGDGFLLRQKGEESLPDDLTVDIAMIQSPSGGKATVAQIAAADISNSDPGRTRVFAIDADASILGSRIEIAVQFDSESSPSLGCCTAAWQYAIGGQSSSVVRLDALPDSSRLEGRASVSLFPGACLPGPAQRILGERARCGFPSLESVYAPRCRIGGEYEIEATLQEFVEFGKPAVSVFCSLPTMIPPSVAKRDLTGSNWALLGLEVRFGAGEWAQSGQATFLYDVNSPPALFPPAETTSLVRMGGNAILPSGAIVQDVDTVGSSALALTFTATHGTLTAGGGESQQTSVTVTGSLNELNELLARGSVTYSPPAEWPPLGLDQVLVSFWDNRGVRAPVATITFVIVEGRLETAMPPTTASFFLSRPITIFEVDGDVQTERVDHIDEHSVAIDFRPHRDCRRDVHDTSDLYPCVVYIDQVSIAGLDQSHLVDATSVTVNVSTGFESMVGIDSASGLQVLSSSLVQQRISFSGSLQAVDSALQGLNFRTFAEDQCIDRISLNVSYALSTSTVITKSPGWSAYPANAGLSYQSWTHSAEATSPYLVFDMQEPVRVSALDFVVTSLGSSSVPFTLDAASSGPFRSFDAYVRIASFNVLNLGSVLAHADPILLGTGGARCMPKPFLYHVPCFHYAI